MIVKLYKKMEQIWFKLNQKIRFLLVGGFNTATAFIIYYIFLYISNGREQLSLLLMNLVNINISIATMRYYVFQGTGPFWKEYTKAFSSYVILYFINMGLLAFFVSIISIQSGLSENNVLLEIPNLDKAIAQMCCVIIITCITFFTHKYFSFRKEND